MDYSKQSFINGRFQSTGDKVLLVQDKFSGEVLSEVSLASKSDVEEAISSSVAAFNEYKSFNGEARYTLIQTLVERLKEQKSEFAKLITLETGKPITYARAEVERCITTLSLSAEEARRVSGEVVPMNMGSKHSFTQRFPKGPVIGISPFNFPLNLALHKIGPALASGCSITIKPSPFAPLSLLAFAELTKNTNMPKGLINIVMADVEEASVLVTDDRFKVFSFTGSPKVGWELKEKAGKKSIMLELGGNAACIVDENSDWKKAAKDIAMGAYLFSGQICISTQRVYIHENLKDDFFKLVVSEIETLKVGNPTDEMVSVGPLISQAHLKRVSDWVEEAKNGGALVLTGGHIIREENSLYAPTLLTNVKPNMKVCSEEVFGPVAIIETFKEFDEAIDKVNDSRFGLQAGVFTDSLANSKKAFKDLEVGAVLINNVPGFRIDHMPYGGVKDSGLGREGVKYTIEEMTEPRLLVF